MWLLLLLIIGAGVAAARTIGRPTPEIPPPTEIVATTPPVRPTSTPPAAAVSAATPRPTVRATLKPTSTPVVLAREGATVVVASAPTVKPATSPVVTVRPTSTTVAAAAHAAAGSVALTFDAGADRGYAEDILDTLQEAHVIASFGITGEWARANPDLVRRMAADGHLVFNHTYDHRSFTGVSDSLGGLSAAKRRSELEQADAIIAPLIGHSTQPYYRLPYGDDDAHVAADVQPAGYTRKIGWTVDSEGWKGLESADILARCLKLAASGAVYVFHVGRASQDAIALPQLIHELRDEGFSFRRVDQAG
jgi:peptidoglycan/xylan/chitin deacetylase (PgdA/CDA1 family)